MTSTYAVLSEGLEKRFGEVHALRGLDLAVAPGTVCGILGPNGAGKTTAIRLLTTLLRPDAGSARVAGHDLVREPEAVRRGIAVTGQYASVDGDLTGRQNLRLFARLHRVRGPAERAAELLDRFGLTDSADRAASTYSGGMRRRVGLARALAVEPEILLYDEPFSALDPLIRREMQDQLIDLQGKLGKTILFIGYSMTDLNIRFLMHRLWKTWAGSGYERDRPQSYVFMLRPNPVEQAVLEQWGLRVLMERDCPPEEALVTFLTKLCEAVEAKEEDA